MVRVDGAGCAGRPLSSPLSCREDGVDLMTPAQRDRFKASLELDLSWYLEGVGRFRVNVFRQRHALGMVLAFRTRSRPLPISVFPAS